MDPPDRHEPTGGGFTTFLYLAIAAAVLVLGLGFVGVGMLASDPRSEGWLDAAGRLFRASYQGQFTPAAHALREAGCRQAVVLSAEDAQALLDAIPGSHAIEFGDSPFVQCRMILPVDDDACAKVARIAAEASDPTPTSLLVDVDGFGACNGLYAPDGTPIEAPPHDP